MKYTIFALLLAALTWTSAGAQPYGCWIGTYSTPPTSIDYYIDDSITGTNMGNISGTWAEWQIRQAVDRFHGESGANINFVYKGTSTSNVCNGSSSYPNPTIIFFADSDCGSAGGAVAWSTHYANGSVMRCGNVALKRNAVDCNTHWWGAYADDEGGATEDDIVKTVLHEAMHDLDFDHVNACATADDDEKTVLESGSQQATRRLRALTRADKKYIRSHYGYDQTTLHYQWTPGFYPGTWTDVSLSPTNVISPANMANSDDNDRGVAYLIPVGTAYESELRAYICEGGSCSVQTPDTANVFYRPDIATSTGQGTEKWMVVGLYNDAMNSQSKDIRLAEKDHGAGSWSVSTISAGIDRDEVSVDYDEVSDTFIIFVVDDEGTNDDQLHAYVRSRTGGAWTEYDTGVRAFNGASVACDELQDQADDRNCLLAWADVEDSNNLKWARFKVNADHTLSLGTIRGMGWAGSSRPSITNDIVSDPDPDPEFLAVFSQAGTNLRTMYVRSLEGSATTWDSRTAASSGADAWYRPAGAGVRTSSPNGYVNYAE